MTAESIIYGALSTLVSGNVFPDVAPAATPAPWITYQAVGGQDFNTVDSETPTTFNARMQITIWSKTRAEAVSIMKQAFQALANPVVKAVPIGGPVSTFEADTLLYGSRLDFSITYT
jgi:hypothetical protein